MKKSLLFCILPMVFYLSQAQEPIPQKANTIIITDTLSASSYWKVVSALLIEKGYGIQSLDKETGTISSLPRSFRNGEIRINILVQDQRVLLRGDLTTGIGIDYGQVSSGPSWFMIEYRGTKNAAYYNAWVEMYEFAKAIPGKKEYLVR